MATEKRTSLGMKLYAFIIITVFGVALGTAFTVYQLNVGQIDRYYKQVAYDSAANFASFVDGDYMAELRAVVESDEFQKLRDEAEGNDDEDAVQEYLEEKGLWEGYIKTRADLNRYLGNMDAIKYLYILAFGDKNAEVDMYLIDDAENPLYETGYYEDREAELKGIDGTTKVEPIISTGDWGWLCSAYAPVYDSKGNVVCTVGCDFGMDDVMAERNQALLYAILAAIILTALVLVIAVFLVNRIVIRPLNGLTREMEHFKPIKTGDYKEAGVAELDIRNHDEIRSLYDGIRSMQMNIIDYINDMDTLQKDKERAEENVRERDEQIGQISKEAYRDSLTGVGSKAAYVKKVEELNEKIASGNTQLAVVMVDMNNLKDINDIHGHNNGDIYIQGCCHLICDTFKHSPVYRIGGDEFVAILDGADYENRHELVTHLRQEYEKASAADTDPWRKYSAAVGIAELASDDMSYDLIFKRADKAMYVEKHRIKEEGV